MGNSGRRVCLRLAVDLLLWFTASADKFIELKGSVRCAGRVEMFHNSSWVRVCSDGWDSRAAQVVCRQLNCGPARGVYRVIYSEGVGPNRFTHVDCEGYEESLNDCDVNSGDHSCASNEDAGVFCSDALQQPSISLTSPDDGLVRSHGTAWVTRGHGFSVTCSVSSSYTPGRFSLVVSGSSRNNTKTAVDGAASFHFPAADYHHQGNYSCVYGVSVSSGSFSSPETKPITVFVTLPLWVMISSVAGGTLMFLLLVLIGVVLIRRTRRRADGPGVSVQTQLAPGDGFEGEEEEDDDYVNVDLPDLQMKQRQPPRRAAADGEDTEHRDFQDNYVVATEFRSFSARCEEDEEEEEGSDDENDYENVEKSVVDRIVDIYIDLEDIYQNL